MELSSGLPTALPAPYWSPKSFEPTNALLVRALAKAYEENRVSRTPDSNSYPLSKGGRNLMKKTVYSTQLKHDYKLLLG